MDTKSAARRLLKSRLRLHVARAFADEQPDRGWPSVIEVEEGISEEAWADWVRARSVHARSELPEIVERALREAVESVREAFAVVGGAEPKVTAFVEAFRVDDLLKED